MTFSIVVPTYNRPESLIACLESVLRQSVLPQELLIVDDGFLPDDLLAAKRADFARAGIIFRYYRKDQARERRGLAESKNIALRQATGDIVFFLDDDIVIYPDFCSLVMAEWEKMSGLPELIGVGGVIANSRLPHKLEGFYNQMFCLSSSLAWDITSVGFQTWNDRLPDIAKGHYAHGGLVSLRRSAARELNFSVFGGGRTGLEDVDFSWRAKLAGFYFIIQPAARADHNQASGTREGECLSGQKETRNRREMFRRQVDQNFLNRFLFAWSLFGWILRQFFAGHFIKGWGMLRGLFKA